MVARAVAVLVAPFPRSFALALGRTLGRAWGLLDRRHVAIAVDNLQRAFPEWGAARLTRTAHGVYAHFGQILLDVLWLQSHSPAAAPPAEILGREHVLNSMAAGRGAVLVTGHIGNWEYHGLVHGQAFGPIGVVARPLDNPHLDRKLCDFRSAGGNTVIYKKRALIQAMRLLREGRGVAILIDQNVQEKDGIFVDFFGRAAATTTVAAALALKTGCALIPCRAVVLPDGRYRLIYDPPLHAAPSGNREADIAGLTQALTARIEAWIRETPEQWLWIHRRWKTQPVAISNQNAR